MTALPFTAFGLFGFMYGIWQVLLAELQRSMGLSDGALGAAITIGFVGSLPSMFFGGKLVDRFGAERVISSTAGPNGVGTSRRGDRFELVGPHNSALLFL